MGRESFTERRKIEKNDNYNTMTRIFSSQHNYWYLHGYITLKCIMSLNKPMCKIAFSYTLAKIYHNMFLEGIFNVMC